MADTAGKYSTFASPDSVNKFCGHRRRFYESDAENEAFVSMIKNVEQDLSETERLLKLESVNTQLQSGSEKLPYVRGVVINTTAALYEIGDWVERARNNEGDTVATFQTRDRWVFNDHGKLVNRNLDLSTCQQALSNVLAILTPLEKIPSGEDPLPSASEAVTSINDDDIQGQRANSEPEVGRISADIDNDPKRLSYPVQLPAGHTTVKRRPVPTNISLPTAPETPKPLTQPQVVEAAFHSIPKPTLSTSTIASTSNFTLSPDSSMPTSPNDPRGITGMFASPAPLSGAESECIQPSSSLDEGHRQRPIPAFKKSPSVASFMTRHSLDLSKPSHQPQSQALTQPKSSQSWPSVAADNTYQTAQQARRVISPRPVFLPSKPSGNSLPKSLTIGHRSSSSTSIVSVSLIDNADVYSDGPPSARQYSNFVSTLPIPPQPWLPQRNLSATNLLGPVNMFDFSTIKDSLRPHTADSDENVNRDSLPAPKIPPKVPIKQVRSFSNLAQADDSTKVTFDVPIIGNADQKLKMASKPDVFLELKPVNYAGKFQFNKPVELPSNIAQPDGAEKERSSKWRTYNRELSKEPIHTIESSHNPPPEVVGLPVAGPRFVKPSPTSWQKPQRQDIGFDLERPVHQEQGQDGLRRDDGVITDESVQIQQGNQFVARPLKQDKAPSDTHLNPTDTDAKRTKTVAEVRRQNRRALLNIMNNGSHG